VHRQPFKLKKNFWANWGLRKIHTYIYIYIYIV